MKQQLLEIIPEEYGYDVRVKGGPSKGGHSIGIFIRSDDGYFYYDDTGRHGLSAAYSLRMIADLLDEVNKPWDDQINEYFKNNPPEINTPTPEF